MVCTYRLFKFDGKVSGDYNSTIIIFVSYILVYCSDISFDHSLKEACETLLHRLEPFIQDDPKGSWESWVSFFPSSISDLSTVITRPSIEYN